MLIMLLLNLVKFIIQILFSWVELPAMPDIVTYWLDQIISIIGMSMGIVKLLFVSDEFFYALLMIVFAIHNFETIYGMLMWIVRKIPFLNMN